MPGRYHRPREVDGTEDPGSGGDFERTRRAGVRRALRGALGIRAHPTRQGDEPRAHEAGKAGAAWHRYYSWSYEDGVFRFFEHPVHFTREQAYEGKYVIQTEEPNLSAVDAVRLYKELSEVERAFANLKDVLDMRPIYHRTGDRVQAHIFVAALAFLLHRAIEKKLKTARLDLSATEALTTLKSVRVVDIDLGDGTTKRSVTRGTQRAAAVLRALGIAELEPPTPPQPGQTIV
jgi:hypothetical protein